jgi:hypothetical protein
MRSTFRNDERRWSVNRIARRVLAGFVFTFIIARSLNILMRTGLLPDLYLQLGETHFHHLNYGIFLLSGVGAYLLFARPEGRGFAAASILYGIGLGLTFDEFGMWLHLDDIYWQRASFDAVVVIAATLGLLIAAPAVRRFRLHHWVITLALAAALTVFGLLLVGPIRSARYRLAPFLHETERVPADQPPAGPSH